MLEQSDRSVHPLNAIAVPFSSAGGKRHGGNALSVPSLSPESIRVPALMLDRRLCVVWQNDSARHLVWQQPEEGGGTDDSTAPHLFDLLCSDTFRSKVDNWRQWTASFLRQAAALVSPAALQRAVSGLENSHKDHLQAILTGLSFPNASTDTSCERLHQFRTDGVASRFMVVGTTFGSVRLVVCQHEAEDSTKGAGCFEWIRRQSQPVITPLFVLAGQLDNANILRDELLDTEYSKLVERALAIAIDIMERHAGISLPYAGCGFMGLFVPADPKTPQPPDLLTCALDVKDHMAELSREWKIRKGWSHNLQFNMGVHADDESLLMRNTAIGEQWITTGDTQRTALRLADLAADGRIWASKALIRRLSADTLQQFRFGVYRGEEPRRIFLSQSFSRICDLSPVDRPPGHASGADGETVTQVLGHRR